VITIESYCICGDDLSVSSSSAVTALGVADEFDKLHEGDGHQRFPTAVEARRWRRE
jgi:hypothetical protein